MGDDKTKEGKLRLPAAAQTCACEDMCTIRAGEPWIHRRVLQGPQTANRGRALLRSRLPPIGSAPAEPLTHRSIHCSTVHVVIRSGFLDHVKQRTKPRGALLTLLASPGVVSPFFLVSSKRGPSRE